MARYIDAENFLESIIEKFKCVPLVGVTKYINGEEYFEGNTLDILINEQPTADVVEVKCRCSECKHLKIINKEPVYAECERQKLTFLLWQADTREHTCSYGERKST